MARARTDVAAWTLTAIPIGLANVGIQARSGRHPPDHSAAFLSHSFTGVFECWIASLTLATATTGAVANHCFHTRHFRIVRIERQPGNSYFIGTTVDRKKFLDMRGEV